MVDVLQSVHDVLLNYFVDLAEELDLSKSGPLLDAFADAISTLRIVGNMEATDEKSKNLTSKSELGLDVGPKLGVNKVAAKTKDEVSRGEHASIKVSGEQRFYLNFGSIQSTLRAVISCLGNREVWLLLDEWSEIPLDLQPYLADLLRRCVIPVRKITLKIAAIEHRCNFILRYPGEYLGIEVGADAGGDVNLDDFMVFDNDSGRSLRFFSALLFKHYRATEGLPPTEGPQTPDEFIHAAFTQITAFEEFVRAVEGVPRDAVYLASVAARKAYNRAIGVQDVRAAARDWFLRDKSSILRADTKLEQLLQWIVGEVIAHRKARAFLLRSNQRETLIDTLFDSRLLHVLKKNISSHDNPGVRYDVYKLDYGCYVDLISTTKAPVGLLTTDPDEGSKHVDVPPDDYRSIRNAILDVDRFENSADSNIIEPSIRIACHVSASESDLLE